MNGITMRSYSYLFAALSLGITISAQAQADKTRGYGASGFVIPGSSAVTFATPKTMQAQPLAQGKLSAFKAHPSSHASTNKAAAQSQTTQPTDTTRLDAPGHLAQTGATRTYPTPLWPYNTYSGLHQGLNVNIGLGVFAMFGKHAPRGAGFTQNLSATWLQPVGKQAWVAMGGYLNNINWNGKNYTSGGIYGELGYQFNEYWAGYIYGQKSVTNHGIYPYGYPYGAGLRNFSPMMYNDFGDKLGAAIRWTPNPTMSIELSVEKNWYPTPELGYANRYKYNYPIPDNQ